MWVVSVAQLVEHRTVAPRVVGSNPTAHPIRRSFGAMYGRPALPFDTLRYSG